MSTAKHKHVAAPKHFLIIRIPAWTDEQADRLEKEVRDKFTAHDVERIANVTPPAAETAPESQPGATELRTSSGTASQSTVAQFPPAIAANVVPKKHVEKFLEQLLADGVAESKIVHALGAFVVTRKPEPAAAPEAKKADDKPAVFGPFAIGDTLRDTNVEGLVLIVAGVDDHGFTFTHPDGASGSAPWSAAQYFEKIAAGKAEAAAKEAMKESVETSASTPAAPTTDAGSPPAGEAAAASAEPEPAPPIAEPVPAPARKPARLEKTRAPKHAKKTHR